ncbi:MAG: helix-turn-helix domain-containing protein [Planctomycetota bacterium]
MKAYSLDLRVRVLADSDEGMPTSAVAAKYSVSQSWVRRLKQVRRETGEIEAKPHNGGPKPKLLDKQDTLLQLVKEQPDATLEQLQQKLDVPVSLSTIWRALNQAGFTLKKSSACIGAGSA